MIEKLIKDAMAEFEQNGRSERFVELENEVISLEKPLFAYFYARYTKGADIERLQNYVLENGTMEQCYYFQRNVRGANIVLTAEKAVNIESSFWVDRVRNLAKKNNEYVLIKDIVKDIPHFKLKGRTDGIDSIINDAREEYSRNGRSKYFIALEQLALHGTGGNSSALFGQCVEGVNVKAFERVALLRGDPFNMFLTATQVPNANKKLMLRGLELAKLDYVEIEKDIIEQNNRRESLMKEIEVETDNDRLKRLIKEYHNVPTTSEYVIQIDNYYISRLRYLIKHEGAYQR